MLQERLALDSTHIDDLQRRGFSLHAIEQRGYRSLASNHRAELAGDIHARLPGGLRGVPGFWQDRGTWLLAGLPGLFIPVVSPHGRIRAWRIRPDDPGEDGKYRWLSTPRRPGGVSSGVHCHIARPLRLARYDQPQWITEGELKADLVCDLLGTNVLSIPGVACWSSAIDDLVQLVHPGGQIVVALDQDWVTNLAVHQALCDLGLACRTLGYAVAVATWDEPYKGVDDLLAAGRHPRLRPLEEVAVPKWPLKISSRTLVSTSPPQRRRTLTVAELRQALAQFQSWS